MNHPPCNCMLCQRWRAKTSSQQSQWRSVYHERRAEGRRTGLGASMDPTGDISRGSGY